MKNALIRDFSSKTIERGGTKIRNIIKAVALWVWLALTQGVHAESDNDIVTVDINWNTFTQGAHAKSDNNIVTVDINWNTFTQGAHAKSDNNIVTVDIDWNTFTYNLWNEDLLATCDKYMDKNEKLLEDCITWAETAMEAQGDLINAKLNESERELDSSNTRLKDAQARNEQTKKDMNVAKRQMDVAKSQMNIAKKEANRVYKQEREKVIKKY